MRDQLFAVVDGGGWVHGAGADRLPIAAGEAVLWEADEEHGARTDGGMTAIVIEGAARTAESHEIGPLEPRATKLEE